MKRFFILTATLLLALPLATALTEELNVSGCSVTGCNASELNTYNNVSGMTVTRNTPGNTTMKEFTGSDTSTINSVSALLSHNGDATISGSWTVSFRNKSDQTVWCTASPAHSNTWNATTLTPTGCGWTPQRLKALDVLFENGDGQQPDDAYIDFFNVTVDYTPPPVSNSFERYTYVNHTHAVIEWRTNRDANSTVSYGQTKSLGSTATNTTNATNHTVRLAGLEKNTLYHYNVTSCDGLTCDTTGPFNFTTHETLEVTACTGLSCSAAELRDYNNVSGAGGDDTTNVSANYSALAEPTATIRGVTLRTHQDSPAGLNISLRNRTSKQEWCSASTTNPYSELSPSGCSWTPSRVDELEVSYGPRALTASTWTIDYSAVLVDWILEPQIHDVNHYDITQTNASIEWNTTNPANSTLEYGETPSLGNTHANTTNTTYRNFTLTGLTNDTTYYYSVTSCTADACETQGPFTFTTLSDQTPTPTSIGVDDLTTSSANITWQTDLDGDSTVRYGTSAAYGNTETNSTNTTSHRVPLTGLSAGTKYYFAVESCNENGCSASGPHTFVTIPPAERCTYRYEHKGDSWKDGLISAGDKVVFECRLAQPLGENTDLTVRTQWPNTFSQRVVTTPRLLYGGTEVLYP